MNRRLVVAALSGAAVIVVAILVLRGNGGGRSEATATDAADAFLSRYVEPDGRVVRRDQGGDTVSEGQGYALLLAVQRDDAATFAKVWAWTEANLRQADGLLAWHWEGGKVVEAHSAADADLDTAWALLLASRRFGDRAYRAEALRMANAILEGETVSLDGRSLLVAGDWATTFPAVVDPSYFAPAAFAALGRASGDPRWGQLEETSAEVVGALGDRPTRLVPDWATVESDGHAVPSGPPGTEDEAVFGYDAVRVPLWQSAYCGNADRSLAAEQARFLDGAMRESPSATYSLAGEPRGSGAAAAIFVATAAANAAAGEATASGEWLARAAAADEAEPTYYGGALVALARASLEPGGVLAC